MSRTMEEKDYWDRNALDHEVDVKYISDISTELCLQDLGEMSGEVLEIGCGVGRLLQDGWYGIDTSENMLEIARKRNPKLKLFNGDGRTLPYDDNQFDHVYSYLVFQHIPKDAVAGYIKEAHRVLKKGGRLAFQCILGNEDEPFSKHLDLGFLKENLNIYSRHSAKQSVAHDSWMIFEATK